MYVHSKCVSPLMNMQTDEIHVTVDEGFLEMVSKCQGHRLDDQRSSLPTSVKNSVKGPSELIQTKEPEEDLFDFLWQMQGSRIEDQRSDMPRGSSMPHIMPQSRWNEGEAEGLSDDELFEMIFSVQVSTIENFPLLVVCLFVWMGVNYSCKA